MASTVFTGISDRYIFEAAGGMRDQLEQTILNVLQEKKYPLKASIKQVKAGKGLKGALFGTSEQCVVIEIDADASIAISNNTVGTYLYVEVYLMVQEKSSIMAGIAALTDNAFKQQKRKAFYYAAKEATEAAFGVLNLKQCNSGFKSDHKEEDGQN